MEDKKLNEEQKREKYNPEDIFMKKQGNFTTSITENPEENLGIVEYKELKWYQKIFEKILKVFRRN